MESKDKVRVSIAGRSFYLTSRDTPEYLRKIAKKTDRTIIGLMQSNSGMTFEQAAILAALKYCDDYEKEVLERKNTDKEDENLGRTLVKYSKELTRAGARIRALEKELEKLKKEQGEK